MRLSPEKQIHMAQLVAKRMLVPTGGIVTKGSEVIVRTKVLDTIRAFAKRDEQMTETAKQKIRSLKRDVPEGSAEWEALFRQHYNVELDRLRKVK